MVKRRYKLLADDAPLWLFQVFPCGQSIP